MEKHDPTTDTLEPSDAPTLPPDIEPAGSEPLTLSSRRRKSGADPSNPAQKVDETASPRRIKKREEREKEKERAAGSLVSTPTKSEQEKLKNLDRSKVFSVFLSMNLAAEKHENNNNNNNSGTKEASATASPTANSVNEPHTPTANANTGEISAAAAVPPVASPFVPQVRSALRACEVPPTPESADNSGDDDDVNNEKKTPIKIDMENSEVPREENLCTCTKYDPHLWKQVCKNCFHPLLSHQDGGRCTHVIPPREEYVPESIRQSISQRQQQTFAESQRGAAHEKDASAVIGGVGSSRKKTQPQKTQFIEQQQRAHNIMKSMLNIPGVRFKAVRPLTAGIGRSWKNFAKENASKRTPQQPSTVASASASTSVVTPQRSSCLSSTPIKSGVGGKPQRSEKVKIGADAVIPFNQEKAHTEQSNSNSSNNNDTTATTTTEGGEDADKEFPIAKKNETSAPKKDIEGGQQQQQQQQEEKPVNDSNDDDGDAEKEVEINVVKKSASKEEEEKKSGLEQAVEQKSREMKEKRKRSTAVAAAALEFEVGDTETVRKEELRYLRQTEYYLKDFIDDGNEEPPIQPLSDMFMTLIATAVSVAGLEESSFAQDFLSAARVALSARPEYAGVAPLDSAPLRGVKTIGKYSYILYRQQEFLKAVTSMQGMITSKFVREYHVGYQRWMVEPFSSWLGAVKSALREERRSCERFDAYDDSASVAAVICLHKDLCTRLEYICEKFPLSECWKLADAFAPFVEGASHAYSELCLCSNNNNNNNNSSSSSSGGNDNAAEGDEDDEGDNAEERERRRAELLDTTKEEITALSTRLEGIIKMYPSVQEKVESNLEKKLIQSDIEMLQQLVAKLSDALAEINRAVALASSSSSTSSSSSGNSNVSVSTGAKDKEKDKSMRKSKRRSGSSSKRRESLSSSSPSESPSIDDGSSGNSSSHRHRKSSQDKEGDVEVTPSKKASTLSVSCSLRKSHSRRKRVKSTMDVTAMKHIPELPSNPKRTVVIEGTITASVANAEGGFGSEKDLCAESEPKSYMYVLYNDFFVAYSPQSPVSACVRLKDTTILSNKRDGTFTLRCNSSGSNSNSGISGNGSGGINNSSTYIFVKKYRPHHHGDLDHLIHQSIAKQRVFGVALEDLLEVEGGETSIPYVAMACMDFVEDNGFNKEGIFRISGKPSVMAALREAFNARSTDIDFSGVSPYDVAHLFKQFLAELPEPILTGDGYTRIMQLDADSALKDNSDEECKQKLVDALHSIVYRLPQAYKDFSRSVFAFFSGCESESYKNKMTAGNLAVVLAPSILRPSACSDSGSGRSSSPTQLLPDMALIKKTNSMVKFLIENYFDIFI